MTDVGELEGVNFGVIYEFFSRDSVVKMTDSPLFRSYSPPLLRTVGQDWEPLTDWRMARARRRPPRRDLAVY